MDVEAIKAHWNDWATRHGAGLFATTKTLTIKKLEVDAFRRALLRAGLRPNAPFALMEAGCGNGVNLVALAKLFPAMRALGHDYVAEMIRAAAELRAQEAADADLSFAVGDVTRLRDQTDLQGRFDVAICDRLIINLTTEEQQFDAVSQLASVVKPGGHVCLIENFVHMHARQNSLREAIGLPPRPVAEFNLFLDEHRFEAFTRQAGLEIVHAEDFGSLHDVALYVLAPRLGDGTVDYDHPMVAAATDLSLSVGDTFPSGFGAFGQNRLYLLRKPS